MTLLVMVTVISVIMLIMFSNMQVEVKTIVNNKENRLFVVIRLFSGLIKYRFNSTIVDLKDKLPQIFIKKTDGDSKAVVDFLDMLELLYKHRKPAVVLMKHILKRTAVKNLSCIIVLGTKDAAVTALITGTLVIFAGTLIEYVKKKLYMDNYKVSILPNYEHENITMDLNCIIRLKIGHAIIAGIKFYFLRKKVVNTDE